MMGISSSARARLRQWQASKRWQSVPAEMITNPITDDEVIARAEAIMVSRLTHHDKFAVDARGILRHASIQIGADETETLLVYWLDSVGSLLGADRVAFGGEVGLNLSIRHICRAGLSRFARLAVLVHNHPGGDTTPSAADIDASKQVRNTLACVGIILRGSYVIGGLEARSILGDERFELFDTPEPGAAICPQCKRPV